MFKVKFIERNTEDKTVFNFYDEISRIPLEIVFSKEIKMKTGRNRDNLSDQSFIEFKFNDSTLELGLITFISLKSFQLLENVKNQKFISTDRYIMYLDDMKNEEFIRFNHDTEIYKINSALLIQFDSLDQETLNYYSLNHRLSIGVNDGMELKSLFIDNIQQVEIELLF